MNHFAERWRGAVERSGSPVCVGIDPVYAKLPGAIRSREGMDDGSDPASASDAIQAFVRGVLRATAAAGVPMVKFQSACFERYQAEGVECLWNCIEEAKALGLMVILDAKRGDIGISAEHYAAASFAPAPGSETGVDALTVNAYLGMDTLQPLLKAAREQGKGLFALVRTSNGGSDAVQSQKLADGRTVGQMMADLVAATGAGDVGESGMSLLGAVVGATQRDEIADLRRRMERQILLVPGYGAQGGGAEDVRGCFLPGKPSSAIITASRSVIYAYADKYTADWTAAVGAAAAELKREIAGICDL
ncbi:MAG: orotidine-5'-phosphate decarboxylase [Phycisphaeraceae bacterium]